MQHRSRTRLNSFARAIMLVATVAFLVQGLTIAETQAAATAGFMPEPAVAFTEHVHFHGPLAAHVHDHSADAVAGHVHDPSAPVDGDNAGAVDGGSRTLCCSSFAVAAETNWTTPSRVASAVDLPLSATVKGIAPPGLVRPPSIPSIA